ncbi:MAG: general secretion pathway protein I [Bradymonadia bacterium]|jgi:general secretion pathway protein I
MRIRRGYTLMEVLIALAILASGLTILLGTQASAARMSERANAMALASMLIRSKMIEVEHELQQDGFSDTPETLDGDFRDEGVEEMEWEAFVEVIEIGDEARESFNAQIYQQLFGGGDSGGALAGASGVSQMIPMIMAMVPDIMNDVSQRARKVTLTVTWPEGDGEMTLTVQQYVVNLNAGGEPGDAPESDGSPAMDVIP